MKVIKDFKGFKVAMRGMAKDEIKVIKDFKGFKVAMKGMAKGKEDEIET